MLYILFCFVCIGERLKSLPYVLWISYSLPQRFALKSRLRSTVLTFCKHKCCASYGHSRGDTHSCHNRLRVDLNRLRLPTLRCSTPILYCHSLSFTHAIALFLQYHLVFLYHILFAYHIIHFNSLCTILCTILCHIHLLLFRLVGLLFYDNNFLLLRGGQVLFVPILFFLWIVF